MNELIIMQKKQLNKYPNEDNNKVLQQKRKREFYFNPRLQGRFHCIRNFTKFTEIKKKCGNIYYIVL